ncbi:MAG: DUF2141 domain-containing protein [Pirellulaceae bacterium]
MLKNLLISWKNNYGLVLISIGIAVGTLLCFVWYKQWLPEIQMRAPLVAQRTFEPRQKNYYVARIETKTAAFANAHGNILIYAIPAEGQPTQNLPSSTHAFQLDENGNATVVQDMTPGLYSALAYLDLNQNGQLDLSPEGHPTEPHRSSNSQAPNHDWRNLSEATFRIEEAKVTYSLIRFGE